MNAIEPVAFEIDGTDIDLPQYSPRLHPRASDWNEVHDFVLNGAAEAHFEEFSSKTVRDRYKDAVSAELEEINDHVPSLLDRYRERPPLPYRGHLTPIYYRDNITLIPNSRQNGYFYMISNNNEHLRDVKSQLVDEMDNFASQYEAMGINDIEIYHGSDFTMKILNENENVTDVSVGEFDNDFEERIFRDLEPLSEAFVNNVTVSFESPQEPEYDILFSLGQGNTVPIEVEDHAGSDSEPSESDVIDDPSSEGSYINAARVFTVVNGVDSDLIAQYRQKAQLTDVNILDESQCPDNIFEYIQGELLQSTLNIEPHRPF